MEWIWVVSGLVAVIGFTGQNIIQKSLVDDYVDIEVSYLTHIYTAIFGFPLTIYFLWGMWEIFTPVLIGVIFISVIANIAFMWAFTRALSYEDVSIVTAIYGVHPLIVTLFEPIFFPIGYTPTFVIGATIVVIGVYILMIKRKDLFAPIQRGTNIGVLLSLASAFAVTWAILADAYVLEKVEPLAYVGLLSTLTAVGFYILFTVRLPSSEVINPSKIVSRRFLPLGLFRTCGLFGAFTSISIATATQYSIIVQLVPLLTVILGGVLLNEENTAIRLIGASLIVVGVLVVTIF